MKYSCNLIKDILPLYHDEVVSKESKEIIENHLRDCDSCRKYYEKMTESDIIEQSIFNKEEELKIAESYGKVLKKIIGKIVKTVVIISLTVICLISLLIGFFIYSQKNTRKISTDINEYSLYKNEEQAGTPFSHSLEDIWPEEITSSMNVKDYYMMYYCPFDSNYLGWLTIEYNEADYKAEVSRLKAYSSSDYIGLYGVTGFKNYNLLAMNANDSGFIYAITDDTNKIIYVEIIFPGYAMDINYEKYIPLEYLPEGLSIKKNNPTQQKVIQHNQESLEMYQKLQDKKH